MASSEAKPRNPITRVIAASLIGTTIEWYDFYLYGTAAALIFNRLYFPTFDPLAGTLAAFGTYAVGFVARPIGGVIIGHEVARALGVRALFTERESGVMRLRRGFTLTPGERCLVVEDVITTGGSTREVVQCVEALGGTVVGVGSLIDRSGGTAAFSVKRVALATVGAATYEPDACPLCKTGSVAVKPGSRT